MDASGYGARNRYGLNVWGSVGLVGLPHVAFIGMIGLLGTRMGRQPEGPDHCHGTSCVVSFHMPVASDLGLEAVFPLVTDAALDEAMSHTVLDLRGLKCPLPALRTGKALSSLRPGATILVQCTDPLAAIDLPHLLRQTGDLLLATTPHDGGLTFLIRRSDRAPEPVQDSRHGMDAND